MSAFRPSRCAPARLVPWLLLCCALGWSGCRNCSLPRIDPTGERFLIPGGSIPPAPGALPEVPGGLGNWGVSVSPNQVIAPVGSEVVLIASVVGEEGFPLIREQVEWSVAPGGVGEIVSPGRRRPWEILNCMRRLPRKLGPDYAVNVTLSAPVLIDRGTPTRSDDVAVNAGQAWISVTSPNEGTSHVTAYAADITGWDRRQQTASIYWVDAQWRLPAPAIATAGGRSSLTTVVTRQTDNAPLPGWVVRYEISGGPAAGFAPQGSPAVEIITGPNGEAPAEIMQTQPAAGTNQVNIQIISPASPAGTNRQLPVGSGTTFQTWTSASETIPYSEPPRTIVPAEPPIVAPQPSTQPFTPAPSLQPQPQPLAQPPVVAPQQPAAPAGPPPAADLEVTVSGPTTAEVGSDARFDIQLVNRGNAPATNVVISNRFDDGLVHAAATGIIEKDLDDLPPGGVNRIIVTFRVSQPGQLCQDITITAAGGARATARYCIDAVEPPSQPLPAEPPSQPLPAEPPVAEPPVAEPNTIEPDTIEPSPAPTPSTLTLTVKGPDRHSVGEVALFVIEVTNLGSSPLEDIEIADHFETTLEPTRATEGSRRLEGNALGWNVDSLAPGRTLRREIELRCLRETPRACNRVTVTVAGAEPVAEEACLEIVGEGAPPPTAAAPQAQLELSVAETSDPIKVDGTTTYQVTLTNNTDQPAFDVEVTIKYNDLLQVLQFSGPSVRGTAVPGGVRFPPIRELRAGETQVFELRAKGLRAGTARVQAEAVSPDSATPTRAEQTTQIL